MTPRAPHAACMAALLACAAGAPAQTTVIDEGSFRLSVDGASVGTETFTIRRNGSGANATTVAQARVLLDSGEQIRILLQFEGARLRPTAYQIEATGNGRQNINGRVAGNRFRATIISPDGEMMREYLFNDNAVILDDRVAHQLHFLAAAAQDAERVPVIIPRQSRQATARIENHGTETIQVAGRQVSTRRLTVAIPDMPTRSVWVDDRNRVIRFSIPDLDFIAERASLP